MSYKAVDFKGKVYAIANSIIYSSSPLGIAWEREHVIYENRSSSDNLSLTITITHHLMVVGADRDIWSTDGKVWHDSKAIKKCTCDMKVIVCKGCQCGGT